MAKLQDKSGEVAAVVDPYDEDLERHLKTMDKCLSAGNAPTTTLLFLMSHYKDMGEGRFDQLVSLYRDALAQRGITPV